MFWESPVIVSYWSNIFTKINFRLQLSLPTSPELALLGMQEDDQRSRHAKLLKSYLLYYANKEILFKWTLSTPPGVSSWETMVNVGLPM